MDKKLLLVLNPISGQKRANRFLPDIIRLFNERGYECSVFVTGARGDAAEHVAKYAENYDRILCIGGDGTLNETVSGLMRNGTVCPIGYIPAGTTNDFAATLGLASNVRKAAKDAADGEITAFDAGELNGRSFIYTATCGAFARASYSTPQNLKNTLGHLAYIFEGMKDLPLHPIQMKIRTEDREIEGKFLFVSITNSMSVGGLIKLEPEMVDLSDGKFEVMLVHDYDTPAQLGRILTSLSSCDIPNELVDFFKASELTVETDEDIEWTLDGEQGESGRKFEIRNLKQRISLILPEKKENGKSAEAGLED